MVFLDLNEQAGHVNCIHSHKILIFKFSVQNSARGGSLGHLSYEACLGGAKIEGALCGTVVEN